MLKMDVTNESSGSLSRKRDSRPENNPHSASEESHLTFLSLFPAAGSSQGIFWVLVHNREHRVSLKRTHGTSGAADSPGFLEHRTGSIVITGALA